ncbi:hypothetical protein [Xanthobacter autotrophicus]|uniref:hypothetical protein n=1 Tax=Xanthobacter autotrophicus TaxID=280 RepID=UPI003729212B
MEINSGEIDLEKLFASMMPPDTPEKVFVADNTELSKITGWDKQYAAAVLSGLCTVPEFHANGIRLDWLLRLVLSKSEGDCRPTSQDLQRVLNEGLSQAGVNRLEDPNEDLFCDLIATKNGNFRIFPGQWEQATAYTQTLVEAFEMLPDASPKRYALHAARSLLTLSDAIAQRAQVDRGTPSEGDTFGAMALPDDVALFQFAQRVRFNQEDLERLGIEPASLIPFGLDARAFPFVSSSAIGDTPLESHPLLSLSGEILVVSPNNISIAVRSVLVNTAISGGMSKRLQYELMRRQEIHAEATGFWPMQRLNLSAPVKNSLRGMVTQYDYGRYLHVLQMPTSFENFPQAGFASIRSLSQETNQFIADDISRFWRFLEKQGDCRESATVLLLTGWGAPHSFAPPIRHEEAPQTWQFVPLTFADAAVLGACDGGNFTDIVRLLKQHDRLSAEGFEFVNANGLLNLFGFFRSTDGNLIPEHLTDIVPPTMIGMGINELLEPRIEGITRRDYRALEAPGDEQRVVQRTEWGKDGSPPIYASVDDVNEGRLSGAVAIAGRTWWIESQANEGESREWRYQIWNAALQWLGTIGATIIERYPDRFPTRPMRITLEIPKSQAFERISAGRAAGSLRDTVAIRRSDDGAGGVIVIQDRWLSFLQSAENIAEIELAAAAVELLSEPGENPLSRTEIAQIVAAIIGTKDWRWLHAFEAKMPLERLAGHQLIRSFKRVPLSASSLVKCQSVWSFRSRAEGIDIEGEDQCREFLARYKQEMLGSIIGDIRSFNRMALTTTIAHDYQAARREQARWRGTIRALRAIRGDQANQTAFERQNEINAVQRAAKAILEITACEASEDDGLEPGSADVEELYAKILLLIGNSQLFATIRAGLIPPKIKLSPAGDVLTERAILSKILEPGALWTTNKSLDFASKAYVEKEQRDWQPLEKRSGWNADLKRAIEAEYGVSAEAFIDLQFALTEFAEASQLGIIAARHSEFAEILSKHPSFKDIDPQPVLTRLTLQRRSSWTVGLPEADIDLGRFDRPFSLINRPLLMLDDKQDDPLVLMSPVLISDSAFYSMSGLMEGNLNNAFWQSDRARSYAGEQGRLAGEEFEESVAQRLRELGLDASPRSKLSAILNQKVPPELGDVDVFAITEARDRVYAIEAKDLRICRTESEAAARMSEYRGRTNRDSKGRERPDKLLRHIRRVQYLRDQAEAIAKNLKLPKTPEVKGLLIVDAPQPMNFHMLDDLVDSDSTFLDTIADYKF